RVTTDSEWIYALFMSQLSAPCAAAAEDEAFEALGRTLAVLRQGRAEAGGSGASSVNLFLATGNQLLALRYCCDFGRYHIDGMERVHEANLSFLSLWYTLGRNYALHGNEWKMNGGAERGAASLAHPG